MTPCWMSIGLAALVMAYSFSEFKVLVAKIFGLLTMILGAYFEKPPTRLELGISNHQLLELGDVKVF